MSENTLIPWGLFILVLMISFSSCQNGKSVEEELVTLKSKAVQLPQNSIITYAGQDTLISNYFDSSYKMVIYTDSASCSSCALNKLYLWSDLITWTQQQGYDLTYYFIFNPPQGESIRTSLRTSLLKYPMLLDINHEFEQLNPHLPQNKSLHTFLLDENNQVVLVGNPLHHPKIEQLFKEELKRKFGMPKAS